MKCKNCGYEIEKPNQRTCPCCGQSLISAPVDTPPSAPRLDLDTPLEVPKQKCPNCHTFVPVGTNFCPNCGKNMKQEEETPPPYVEPDPVRAPEPVYEPEPQQAPEPIYEPASQPAYEPEPVDTPDLEPIEEPEPAPQPDYGRRRRTGAARSRRMSERNYNNPSIVDEPDDTSDDTSFPDDNGWSGAQIVSDGTEPQPPSNSASWLVMTGIAIGSLLLGSLLYFIF